MEPTQILKIFALLNYSPVYSYLSSGWSFLLYFVSLLLLIHPAYRDWKFRRLSYFDAVLILMYSLINICLFGVLLGVTYRILTIFQKRYREVDSLGMLGMDVNAFILIMPILLFMRKQSTPFITLLLIGKSLELGLWLALNWL